MITLDEFIINFINIKHRIESACKESGRAVSECSIIACNKDASVDAIEYAAMLD